MDERTKMPEELKGALPRSVAITFHFGPKDPTRPASPDNPTSTMQTIIEPYHGKGVEFAIDNEFVEGVPSGIVTIRITGRQRDPLV